MRKIGIMGGTFNPIHNGHLLIAENAYEQLNLDEVHFIPTGRSPHKQHQHILDSRHRMQMVSLAIEGNPAFVANDCEIQNAQLSYSYLTLERLHEQYRDTEFYFIMGGDSLRDFKTWRNPQRISELAILVAAVRDACDIEQLQTYAQELYNLFQADVRIISTPNLSVKSSELRERVSNGKSIRYQVPECVREYIQKEQLYLT